MDTTDTDDLPHSITTETPYFKHVAIGISLVDYAQELSFLPDLAKLISNKLDYSGENVICSAHTETHRAQLVGLLQKHEGIVISSRNALPPLAYGVVCDIDVQGHDPIKQ